MTKFEFIVIAEFKGRVAVIADSRDEAEDKVWDSFPSDLCLDLVAEDGVLDYYDADVRFVG